MSASSRFARPDSSVDMSRSEQLRQLVAQLASLATLEDAVARGVRAISAQNFRLRCDTIDDSGGSTQRHDDEDKCAK